MKAFIKDNKTFIKYVLYTFIPLLISWFFLPKGSYNLWVDYLRSPILDSFFLKFTHIGDGLSVVVVFAIYLFVKPRKHLRLLVFAFLIQGIIVLVMKELIFKDLPRPSIFLGDRLQYIPGVRPNEYYTFPSGHTTTAFMLFFWFSVYYHSWKKTWLFFALAFLIGFSRVYLHEHFMKDVGVGALLGTLSMVIAVWIESKIVKKRTQ